MAWADARSALLLECAPAAGTCIPTGSECDGDRQGERDHRAIDGRNRAELTHPSGCGTCRTTTIHRRVRRCSGGRCRNRHSRTAVKADHRRLGPNHRQPSPKTSRNPPLRGLPQRSRCVVTSLAGQEQGNTVDSREWLRTTLGPAALDGIHEARRLPVRIHRGYYPGRLSAGSSERRMLPITTVVVSRSRAPARCHRSSSCASPEPGERTPTWYALPCP